MTLKLPDSLWSLAAALAVVSQVSAVPTVNIGLNAAFEAGPYIVELLETAAGENATSYFPLLDRIANGDFAQASTELELYDTFLKVLSQDGHITTPESLSTFNLALALRTAAPRLEAHYQYYDTAVEPSISVDDSCRDWVLLDNHQYCTPQLNATSRKSLQFLELLDLPFDRKQGRGQEAVLYADPCSASFGSFHQALSHEAIKGQLTYRLRYRRSDTSNQKALPISGYGVELALKRTDYIVIDDREAGEDATGKPLASDVILDGEEELADLKPLSTSELADLGLKSGTFIMQSESPLDTLVKLTQDFPKFSSSIASHDVSKDFANEHMENRAQMVPSGLNYLWINGAQIVDRQVQPFALLDVIRQERRLIQDVCRLGLTGKQAISLLGHEKVTEAKANDESPRFDWTDRLEDGRVIIWLNDLEKDEQYADFPKPLRSLLQRSYPGQIPAIGRNIFHMILPVDLTDPEDMAIVSQILGLMRRGIPVRFGLVPLVDKPAASSQAMLAYHLVNEYGVEAWTSYVRAARDGDAEGGTYEKAFSGTIQDLKTHSEASPKTVAEVLAAEAYLEQIKLAGKWSKRLSAGATVRTVFVDGIPIPRDKSWMQAVSMKLAEDLQIVQKAIFEGSVDETSSWVPELLLEGAASRRNFLISSANDALRIVDVGSLYESHAELLGQMPILVASPSSVKEEWAVLTVIADLALEEGRSLLLSALSFKRQNPGVRLDVMPNPSTSTVAGGSIAALKNDANNLADIQTTEELSKILQSSDAQNEIDISDFLATVHLAPGSQGLILNGRIIGPIPSETAFLEEDFQELLKLEQRERIIPVYSAMEDLGFSELLDDPVSTAKITSLIALSTISDMPEGIFESASSLRTTLYDVWSTSHTAIELGNPETANIHIVSLLNPLSEQGQRWAPIIKVLSELDGVYLKLFINPKDRLDELPVKRFYRYALGAKPSFDDAGNMKMLNATFKGLPSEALLTTALNVPPAWLVAPKASVYDLDNIRLGSFQGDVEALYELKHMLIEGHSREGARAPPKGAQLVLSTGQDSHLTDTIVMANLGFFQFKANPGVYNIQLKEGRSSDIYTIESVGAQGWEPVAGDEGADVVLMDFQGSTLYPRLKRKPGMEKANVLDEVEEPADNILAKGFKLAEGFFGGSKKTQDMISVQEHAEINIFSVASGHLYERMLNIMMVSVMKNTKHTVKFWFIEQFLSPSFKEFIPHLAEEYGFKFEMITYKWPHWLRQQKEKQREIWGYKILFLDVLFPLSLDKVIFVDADQIVRTDMIDLVKLDLQGAPYGFTPMCDSRTEMEGFRFWKQGYWANYLKGLPYHISALYVVDLRRFRELAAGDRLRQQYQALSADPNSLSNLDQDLPNHMQFQIPIHSLPQEWLWCETWCSDESQAEARTIDLCNNPETKEPKLDRARRQVPEWTVYDEEIAALVKKRKVAEEGTSDTMNVNSKSRRFEDPVHTRDEL